jgi:hypothetical protein
MISMKCHHCYHKFHTPWCKTIGQTVLPPANVDANANSRFIPIGRARKLPAANDGHRRRRTA